MLCYNKMIELEKKMDLTITLGVSTLWDRFDLARDLCECLSACAHATRREGRKQRQIA